MKAYLYIENKYTVFKVNNKCIKFYTSPYLKRYVKVKEYDAGYMVVDIEMETIEGIVEDYIDMEAIMQELCLDTSILKQVHEVIIL